MHSGRASLRESGILTTAINEISVISYPLCASISFWEGHLCPTPLESSYLFILYLFESIYCDSSGVGTPAEAEKKKIEWSDFLVLQSLDLRDLQPSVRDNICLGGAQLRPCNLSVATPSRSPKKKGILRIAVCPLKSGGKLKNTFLT